MDCSNILGPNGGLVSVDSMEEWEFLIELLERFGFGNIGDSMKMKTFFVHRIHSKNMLSKVLHTGRAVRMIFSEMNGFGQQRTNQ